MVNRLLFLTFKTKNTLESMSGQVQMMMTLMRDLMNQAEMTNNTFNMVNEYFNCIDVIK